MKTILFLIPAYPSYSETFIYQDIQMLRKRGLNIKIVSLWKTKNQDEFLLNPHYLHTNILKKNPHINKIFNIFGRNTMSTIRHRNTIQKLIQYIHSENISHIHGEFADLPALLASIISLKCHISYSIGIHASGIFSPKFDLKKILNKAKFITICNKKAEDKLLQTYPALQPKVHFFSHGVNLDKMKYREPMKFKDTIHLLFVGRLVPKKGLDLLLQALNQLHNSNLSLTIIGDGDARKIYEDIPSGFVALKWRGVLTHQKVLEEMRVHDLLITPGRVTETGDMDGLPNVILEAMAIGLPVLSTNCGSKKEIISEETAWICPEIAIEPLAKSINNFLTTDICEIRKKSQNAREEIINNFDRKRITTQRKKLFETI